MGSACGHNRPDTFDRFLNLCHCDERTFLTRRKFRFTLIVKIIGILSAELLP